MDELDKIIAERSKGTHYGGWTKLHHACNLGLHECIKTILADGADVNACTTFGYTPLDIACYNSNGLECAKLLIAAGADVNLTSETRENLTPLHVACVMGAWTGCVKFLLAAGANISAQTSGGLTPLHFACRFNREHVTQTLLEAGADPTIRNNQGHLPQDNTNDKKIKDLINNFGLGGGRATKEAQ